ncbi:hypothetical protein OROMI_011665 [Orobanche minor]
MGKVEPYNFWDGVGNGGARDDEFENILNILDFPMESLEGDGFVGDWDPSNSQYLGPIPSDVIIGPPAIVTGPTISPPTPILSVAEKTTEYRPAASPTFVPSLHSNSHRKVVEMRSKAQKDIVSKIEETPSVSPEMEFVPMSSYLFDHIC